MAFVDKVLRNRRAGDHRLAWNRPNLSGGSTFELTSPDFAHESTLDPIHAAERVGGSDLSPALTWSGVPEGTAHLLLVVEDPDAPTPIPVVHCLALIDPALTNIPRGGLSADTPAPGVRILRSSRSRGYRGPAPIKSHGPHRYAFELFALPEQLTAVDGKSPEAARPDRILATAHATARARTDGFYERA